MIQMSIIIDNLSSKLNLDRQHTVLWYLSHTELIGHENPAGYHQGSICSNAKSSSITYQYYCTPTLSVGVSLMLQGVTVPNNSLVDVCDILYHIAYSEDPSNSNPALYDQALLCVTDLIDCCR